MTVPVLPVVHGTTLTLNCPEGYTNLGGNTATCLYGQVLPTNGSPVCHGKIKGEILLRHDRLRLLGSLAH